MQCPRHATDLILCPCHVVPNPKMPNHSVLALTDEQYAEWKQAHSIKTHVPLPPKVAAKPKVNIKKAKPSF